VGVWGRLAAPEDQLFSPVQGDFVALHRRKRKILGGLAALQTFRQVSEYRGLAALQPFRQVSEYRGLAAPKPSAK